MNCAKAERWLSQALDGELSPRRAGRLDRHMAGCPACRKLKEDWTAMAVTLRRREIPAGQTVEAAWADVRRAIRLAEAGTMPELAGPILGSRRLWATAMLAIVALGIGAFWFHARDQLSRGGVTAGVSATEVEWVETDLPGATPVVYQDAATGCAVIWIVEAEEAKVKHAG